MLRELLTASRLNSLRRCAMEHYLRYELGLSRIRTAQPLRLGAAYHRGLKLRNKQHDEAFAIEGALSGYDQCPEWMDEYEWLVERETVRTLLRGYCWRYQNDNVTVLEAERAFEMPLENPNPRQRCACSRSFALAGKIDGIGLADDRIVVDEYKTSGEDIGPDSDYWLRLRCDPQVSMYVLGARAIGYNGKSALWTSDVNTVLYDVVRKPTIQPLRATPAEKQKYTKDGRLYANQREQDETPEEFGERLFADMQARPDFYFQRREIPRLDDELAMFHREVWDQAKLLLERRRRGWWERNVSWFTCRNCEFCELCLNSINVTPDNPPSGYEFLTDVHPELGDDDL